MSEILGLKAQMLSTMGTVGEVYEYIKETPLHIPEIDPPIGSYIVNKNINLRSSDYYKHIKLYLVEPIVLDNLPKGLFYLIDLKDSYNYDIHTINKKNIEYLKLKKGEKYYKILKSNDFRINGVPNFSKEEISDIIKNHNKKVKRSYNLNKIFKKI
jgi:hypothetical protein